jgi:hypothetical protein
MRGHRNYKGNANPYSNEYLIGISQRLSVDPHRVECQVRIGPGGGFLLDVRVDGRDLNSHEERLVKEYLEEAFHGLSPRVEG